MTITAKPYLDALSLMTVATLALSGCATTTTSIPPILRSTTQVSQTNTTPQNTASGSASMHEDNETDERLKPAPHKLDDIAFPSRNGSYF